MGCCEISSSDTYMTPIALHPSILLKSKKHPAKCKKVHFEFSYTHYQNLDIIEEDMPIWCKSAMGSDLSLWEMLETELFGIYYFHDGENLTLMLKLSFGFNIDPQSLVCLINNPKYRVLWDQDLKKIKVLFGDCNLDALVEISETEKNCRLFERKVRISDGVLYCFYVPHKDESGNCYFFAAIPEKNSVQFVFKDQVSAEEVSGFIEKIQLWAARLVGEILIHRNF